MSKIYILFLDNLNNIIEELNILKPKTYQKLIKQLETKYKNIKDNYNIFILDKNNEEIKIINEQDYKIIDYLIFIREINKKESINELNNHLLSESKREMLDEKYNCFLCSFVIKKEKPYLCYNCQKIFYEKCLNDLYEKCKLQNKNLICPNCRYELPIQSWNKKLDFEEIIKNNEDLIKKVYEYKLNKHINIIKDKKITELKLKITKQKDIIKKYEKYIEQSMVIFKNILNKIISIHSLLEPKYNNDNNYINELINISPLNFNSLFNNISKVINEELDELKNYIINHNKTDNNFQNNENEKNNIDNKFRKVQLNINLKKLLLNKYQTDENKINLIYFAKIKGNFKIFGEEFVLNNKGNLDLIINGKENNLVSNYKLKRGENNITMIIKNRLNNVSHIFSGCDTLKDIKQLKHLDISNIRDFSSMFWGCLSLSDITSLEDWDVSNITNFSHMFGGCSLLKDITPLQNWDVSNGINFENMFWGCSLLTDITPIKNWKVSNGNNFSFMFSDCLSLLNIIPLQNWNISKESQTSYMFLGCSLLSDLTPFQDFKSSKTNEICQKNFNDTFISL